MALPGALFGFGFPSANTWDIEADGYLLRISAVDML
jgi:hypothetical protein